MPGSRDEVAGDVEWVEGSYRPDVLIGDSDADRFFGYKGGDRLEGRGGRD